MSPSANKSRPPKLPPDSPSLLSEKEISRLTLGIDEAGRGCLAGPVVAAAVLLPSPCPIVGLADSKVLKAITRERLAAEIKKSALAFGLGVVWQADIDRINILQATFEAMSRAVASLAMRYARHHTAPLPPALLLIDGNKTIPLPVLMGHWPQQELPAQRALVDGDALDQNIGAASIVAKTFRDALMISLHKRWPQYNFAKHMGYGTKEHLAALTAHGPSPLHRLTFARVLPGTQNKKNKKAVLASNVQNSQGSLL